MTAGGLFGPVVAPKPEPEPLPPSAAETGPKAADPKPQPKPTAAAVAEPKPEPEPVSEPPTPKPEPPPGYRVLALAYRPQTFADLIGQDAIVRTLQNAIRKDRVWNAFLFAGPRGVGKTTTARVLAKALNCHATDGPNPEPCGRCSSCDDIAGSRARDVPEIDGASVGTVETVREIIEAAQYAPTRDRFKVYLVDEVHMLSTPAFNALLKTLEEPPPRVKFIFATTEIHKIPETILSRCQEFEFRTVSQRQLMERMTHIVEDQGLTIAPVAVAQIARFAQGSVRDSISALDQVLAAADREVTVEDVNQVLGVPDVSLVRAATEAILKANRRAVFEVVDRLVRDGRDLRHFVTMLLHYLRDVVVRRAAPGSPELLEWADEAGALQEFAGQLGEADLLRSLDVLVRVEDGLRFAPEPRFHLEMALLRLVELPRLADFDVLLDRLDRGAGAAGPNAPAPGASAPTRKSRPAPPPEGTPARPEPPAIAREYQASFGGDIVPRDPSPKPGNPSR